MNIIKDENDLFFSKGKILFFNKEIVLHKSYEFNNMILIGLNKKAAIKFNNGSILLKNNNYLYNLRIRNASNNGIEIIGNNNIVKNVTVSNCKNTGIQINSFAFNNKIINCFSYENKQDGFGCKFKSGENNVFKKCIAYNNGDDGFDLFEAKYGVRLINCLAYKNCNNGFKLGGFSELEKMYSPEHFLKGCFAYSNKNYGFTADNQVGTIIMKKCTAFFDGKKNFNFPKYSLYNNKEIKNGNFYLYKCYAHNQLNDITGVINKNTGL